jgi:hypothetical protein
MSAYHKFRRVVEDAIAGLITRRAEGVEGLTIYKGMQLADMADPRIEVWCDEVEPEVFGEDLNIGGHITGNFFGTVHCRVVASFAGLTRDAWAEYCGAVEDVLMTSDLVEQLNDGSVSGWQAFAWRPGPSVETVEDDQQVAACDYTGRIYGCPSIPEG